MRGMGLVLENCEGIILSLDSHKSVPAPFLTKTYQLVDDPSTDHIVSWGEDDTTFVVWRPPEFARDLLPNYFKHNNFSSFVRQLNTYGFRKIVPDRWEFANELFKKGEKHLLCDIHRRKTAQPQPHHHHGMFPRLMSLSPSPPNDSDSEWCEPPSPTPLPSSNYNNASVTALSQDNERLRRSNTMLMSELAHMKKLYNDIIYFVQNHVKPVAPSSLLFSNNTPHSHSHSHPPPSNPHYLGYYPTTHLLNSPTSKTSLTIVEEPSCKTKLFGVSLQSKKRVHPDYAFPPPNPNSSHPNKPRLLLENHDLALNLMPSSSCFHN
ncbi:heat stress transcription factor B-4 [Senna tora]|uniref:Heat stress transcription factor B-4 n=1 Tax=Senna tora TaxID=362788 RepID=A0A834WBS5_9FABA|nr:heat stress transcription factor B-4 [Senna tora]